MSNHNAQSRLRKLASHFWTSPPPPPPQQQQQVVGGYNRAELSPTYFLPKAAAIEPDAEAIVHTTANGKVLRRSYREFADRARGLGFYLKSKGYKRVGVLCPNTPAFLESIFGIPSSGAIQIGVNYRLKKSDIHYIFTHAEVDLIIVDHEFVSLLEGFNPSVPLIIDSDTDATEGELSGGFDRVIGEGLAYDRAHGGAGWDALRVEAESEDDVVALAYTSGTTARPKGVEFTHRGGYLAALGNVVESQLNCGTTLAKGRAKYLTILPLFHAVGWTFPWAVVAARATHYCLRKIDYDEIWHLLQKEGITHFNAAPTVNTLLCNSPKATRLQQEVRVTVAASPPSPTLFKSMIALNLVPVHVYGMTETYGPVTKSYFLPQWHNLKPEEMYQKMARQGHGFITSKMARIIKMSTSIDSKAIIDVKKDGKEIGEIVFTGNLCAKGYYKDPVATAKLFEGGVLHTGDLAVWHEDGSIQILDRAKDIIISGGENISSVSLESLLSQHPQILEVGVVAVPDSHYGERPKAFITTKNSTTGTRELLTLTGEEVIKWAKKNPDIAGFMVPREVEIVEELPKTSTGKVKKGVLREWVKGNRDAR